MCMYMLKQVDPISLRSYQWQTHFINLRILTIMIINYITGMGFAISIAAYPTEIKSEPFCWRYGSRMGIDWLFVNEHTPSVWRDKVISTTKERLIMRLRSWARANGNPGPSIYDVGLLIYQSYLVKGLGQNKHKSSSHHNNAWACHNNA